MKQRRDQTVLVLQGGGALGAYQAGVYEGIAEAGLAPNWVAGVSVGAINAALIAGNPPGRRIERLREFWDRVSSTLPLVAPVPFDPLRVTLNRLSAATAATFGVPGFYVPRQPPAFLAPDGTPGALSVYDTSPLRQTLQELVDFDLLNRKEVRLSVGAVDVRTGNSVYFDNQDLTLGPEHVMASGSLPPGFPSTLIDGAHYWDGRGKSSTVAQDKANLYLYRDPNIRVAVTTKLSVNGKEVEATKRTTCGHWEVNPGTYDISSESESASTVRIVAEAGKSYYVWQEVKITMGYLPTNELHVVDADTGRRGVRACGSFLETKPVETP